MRRIRVYSFNLNVWNVRRNLGTIALNLALCSLPKSVAVVRQLAVSKCCVVFVLFRFLRVKRNHERRRSSYKTGLRISVMIVIAKNTYESTRLLPIARCRQTKAFSVNVTLDSEITVRRWRIDFAFGFIFVSDSTRDDVQKEVHWPCLDALADAKRRVRHKLRWIYAVIFALMLSDESATFPPVRFRRCPSVSPLESGVVADGFSKTRQKVSTNSETHLFANATRARCRMAVNSTAVQRRKNNRRSRTNRTAGRRTTFGPGV